MSPYLIAALVFMLFAAEASGYCTQYRGGISRIHHFTCCDGSDETYQGGGSTNSYCNDDGSSNSAGRSPLHSTVTIVMHVKTNVIGIV